MSQEDSKWIVITIVNGLRPTDKKAYIDVYWGYCNQLVNLLLTSWDIQVYVNIFPPFEIRRKEGNLGFVGGKNPGS